MPSHDPPPSSVDLQHYIPSSAHTSFYGYVRLIYRLMTLQHPLSTCTQYTFLYPLRVQWLRSPFYIYIYLLKTLPHPMSIWTLIYLLLPLPHVMVNYALTLILMTLPHPMSTWILVYRELLKPLPLLVVTYTLI